MRRLLVRSLRPFTTLAAGQGADMLIGGSGDAPVAGGRRTDVARLGDGNDLLFGGLGDDVLGQDVLDGGPGDNTLLQ